MECRARGLPVSPVTETSTTELLQEEYNLDLDVVYNRLEQMKLRAKELRKLLVKEKPMASEYTKCVEEIEDKGSRNKEVRAVQLQTLHLVSQLTTLSRQLQNDRCQAHEIEQNFQKIHGQNNQLFNRIETLQKWPEKVKLQTAICLDRYNDLDICCIDLEEMSRFIRETYEYFPNATRNKVPVVCYRVDFRNVAKRLENAWQTMHVSFEMLQRTCVDLRTVLESHKLEVNSRVGRSISRSIGLMSKEDNTVFGTVCASPSDSIDGSN